VHTGQTVFVKSTAAGAAGEFFDLVQEADDSGPVWFASPSP
jgi:hypothetical protein